MVEISTVDKEIEEKKKELENIEGTPCSVFTRIVGYYRAVKNWNNGKRAEFNFRKKYDILKKEQK